MRSRTTSRIHITSLGYGETIATQVAKKDREYASGRIITVVLPSLRY